VIILKDVTSVRKAKTAGLFPNAIEIEAWGKKVYYYFLSEKQYIPDFIKISNLCGDVAELMFDFS
jgi:hypothetical protein